RHALPGAFRHRPAPVRLHLCDEHGRRVDPAPHDRKGAPPVMRWRGAVREGVPAHRPAVARAPVATQAPGAARTLAPLSCRPPGFWRSGDPLFFATAGAVAVSLILVGGLALLILTKGLGYFWPT